MNNLVITNVRHAWLGVSAVREMREKLKLRSDDGDSGTKQCKRSYRGAYSGVWRSLRLAGIWSLKSGRRFCVGVFRGEDVFTFTS
jgi:hypothetical protein